jgi:hypothetical protein
VNVYPFIEAEKRGRRNVKRACELLRVSRAAFYDYLKGPSGRGQQDADLAAPSHAVAGRTHDAAHPQGGEGCLARRVTAALGEAIGAGTTTAPAQLRADLGELDGGHNADDQAGKADHAGQHGDEHDCVPRLTQVAKLHWLGRPRRHCDGRQSAGRSSRFRALPT